MIFTHAHPDHLGETTDAEGKLLFPRARYIIWKTEWDSWTSEQADRALADHGKDLILSMARKNLTAIRGQVDLVDTEAEIIPGISPIAAPGHIPGHIALSISAAGQQLLCLSDTVLHPIHLAEQGWCAAVDAIPKLVSSTRQKLLTRAAEESSFVLAFHFPFPGLGHVLPNGRAWQWQPLIADTEG